MKLGKLCEDGVWRCVTSIYDAISMDWGKAKAKILRIKTPDKKLFENIYGCKFVNDADSEFSMQEILDCVVDVSTWKFYKSDGPHPVGNMPCSAGYDPAGEGDNATFAIMTMPERSFMIGKYFMEVSV